MGYTIFMDENGDAQGNYTLLALDTKHEIKVKRTLYKNVKKEDKRIESSNRKTACKSISSGACSIYVVGSLISQFCIETFFLKTSHGQMFTLQFISNVLLFRALGGFVRSGGGKK